MKKILIADDEHKIIMTLEYAFRKAGYEVFIARDGSEVLELLKTETPDLILLDIMMPNVDGYTTLAEIKKDKNLSGIKIILYSTAGLKDDGKALIDYIDKKNIAIDFSHTSDALAYDILNYVSKENITVPIIASHSNYRPVFEHARNLPNDVAQEIIRQQGLIGLNFVRAFVNPQKAKALEEHVAHGISLGGENAICYGADYFYTKDNADKSRIPFYFKEHDNAGCYPEINKVLEQQFGAEQMKKISSKNALGFIERLWK